MNVEHQREQEDGTHIAFGMILCKSKNRVIVEYMLRDMRKPIGVVEYQLTQQLPEYLQQSLPAIEEVAAMLAESTMEQDAPNDEKTYVGSYIAAAYAVSNNLSTCQLTRRVGA